MFDPYQANPYLAQFNSPYNAPNPFTSPQPQTQSQAPQTAVLYAPTAKDFAGVSVQPGRQALVIAQNEPFMAFKVADNMGMVTTSLYRIEQIDEAALSATVQEYATKAEFNQLQQIVQQIVDGLTQANAKQEGASNNEPTT